MFEPTGSQRDAASAIFNLPDYRVLHAVDGDDGVRRVEVESTAPPGCPVCGVLAERVHSRRRQRLRDLPVAGPTEVVWVKRRWFCDQARCPRGTFSEVTEQVPAYARSTARLCQALVAAVVVSGRAASEVARAHRVSWWLVQSMLTAAADLIGDPDQHPVRRLGVDEHRYRRVRFFRDENLPGRFPFTAGVFPFKREGEAPASMFAGTPAVAAADSMAPLNWPSSLGKPGPSFASPEPPALTGLAPPAAVAGARGRRVHDATPECA
mgnify:CR=1 FL=1